MTSSAPLLTPSTRRLEMVTDDDRGNRRRRTLATSVTSATSATTPPSIFAVNSRSMTARSRSITVTSETTNGRPLLPEMDKTTMQLPSDDDDSGGDDDAIAAAFRQTSWQCRSEPYWRRMPAGTFPPYIQTARCRQTRCMLGMYECVARRYGVKVLRRVDGRCLPVPLIAAVAATPTAVNTTALLNGDDFQLDLDAAGGALYEQAWTFVETQVVVGCDCAKRRNTGALYGFPMTRAP